MQKGPSAAKDPEGASSAPHASHRLVPRISSRKLMRHQPELIIEHDGREYRLRITQSGKLILTA